MVQQGMPLLSATVRNNLSLFDPNISDVEIQKACKTVAIWEQIKRLPDGLDTTLEGTAQISVEEKSNDFNLLELYYKNHQC